MDNLSYEKLILENRLLKQRLNYLESLEIKAKLQEDALERWHERFEAIVDSIEDYYFELDIDGRHVAFSGRTLSRDKIEPSKFIGKTQEEILGKDLAKIHIKNNRKALQGKRVVYQWSLEEGNGKRIFQTSLSPIRNKKEKIIGIIGVGKDITEKMLLNESIIQEKKGEMLALVSGGIAHDFNNILTVIKGNCFLGKLSLKQVKLDKLEKTLEEIEIACSRAKDLTTQLLTFSKKGAIETTSLSIEDLIKETVDFTLTGTSVTCNYFFEPGLKNVEGNEAQIGQVLNNLVVNACQAMEDGGQIDITVRNYKHGKNSKYLYKGEYIYIEFKDYGKGISKKNLHKIFEPYFSTKEYGSGLGLATSYTIISRHGGHIRAESQRDKGTTFHIYLPTSTNKEITAKKQNESVFYGRGTILIMEDEAKIRKLLAEMLKYLGYDVILTKNSFETISTYRRLMETKTKVDLVILDLTIPGGEGAKKVIKKLKIIDSKIKAVVTSGYSENNVLLDYQSYGFQGAIYKPFKLSALSKEIHKVISLKDEENHGHFKDREASIS